MCSTWRKQVVVGTLGCAVSVALAAIPPVACAQLAANPFQTGKAANGIVGADGGRASNSGSGASTTAVGRAGARSQAANLTPDQIGTIMMLRALQSRGSGRVRYGVPQFIPFGAPPFIPYPQRTATSDDRSSDDAKTEARRQRLSEARKAAEEKRRAAREARLANAKAKGAKPRPQGAAQADQP